MKNSEIYAAITEKIIANLETAGSWDQLWHIPAPVNLLGRYYQGVNHMVLSSLKYGSRVYGTFQQFRSNGGMVRRGEKSTIIVFWKREPVTDEKTGETSMKFLLRYYHVFNSDQADFDLIGQEKVDLLNEKAREKLISQHRPAEDIISNYYDKPGIQYTSSTEKISYSPALDLVTIPNRRHFDNQDAFYRSLFHEFGHSTGHPSRLDRSDGLHNHYGDELYSREELVAELCSSYLCAMAGLHEGIMNSTAYIAGWSRALRENTKWILWAAARAEKAAEYILGSSADHEHNEGLIPTEEAIPF